LKIQKSNRRASKVTLGNGTTIAGDELAAIFRRSLLWTPERLAPSAWLEHVPFAFWLVDVLRPKTIVELGTHTGVSYSAFCQAVKTLGLSTRCYAVDTWKGDEHAGVYSEEIYNDLIEFHDRHYSAFSRLVRSTFDDALLHFEDGTIDLLHIDGFHTYEAVRHDFESWLPKLSSNAVVILHDTNVRENNFGVFRLWSEIASGHPTFTFLHGHGLGVLGLGHNYPSDLRFLFDADEDGRLVSSAREIFASLGRSVRLLYERSRLDQALVEREAKIAALDQALVEREAKIAALDQALVEREAKIAALDQALVEREAKIAALDQALTEREAKVATLGQALDERNREIGSIRSALSERDAQIGSLNLALAERDRQTISLSGTISEIYSSNSWRITKPFRWCGRQMRRTTKSLRLVRYALSLKGGILSLAASALRVLRREGLAGLKLGVVRIQRSTQLIASIKSNEDIDLYQSSETINLAPKISVIVPNYNHKRYLRERLESIYNQAYENFEVILLDDCSTDESQEVLLEYANRFPDKTKYYFNKNNSGGVFNQWEKGLELATGDLVWIAESDDYCTTNLLAELSKCFENQAVMLAFCRSDFITGEPPVRVWTTEEYWSSINFNRWENGFVKAAHWLVNNGWTVRNIIPNASSAVFRHPGMLDIIDATGWKNLKLCGDWIFYLTIARGGLVAYSPNATNFYRQHSDGTSKNVQRNDSYYQEYEIVAKTLVSLYRLNSGVLEHQRDDLYEHWKAARGGEASKEFRALYNLDHVWVFARKRKPNLVLVAYALAAGGGETFPILLANLFKSQGYGVTMFNAKQEKTEAGVRRMLGRNVPLLEIDQTEIIPAVLDDIGAEIVHTHHANMDFAFSTYLSEKPEIKHVVTTHGMYEMLKPEHVEYLLPIFAKRIDCFVYAAEKNLSAFPKGFRDAKRFVQINNALPLSEIKPVLRSEMGIEAEAFALCFVARAIPDKGWEEAVQAVTWARNRSKRKIHILLIGEGPEYERLKSEVNNDFVHFLGFRANIRDYFAASDIGFLPSRFKGESYPLVLIDCLLAGRPMLASNIGEISAMLSAKDGLAGETFDLQDWAVPIQTVGELIVELANNKDRYQALMRQVPDAAAKFDTAAMVKKYSEVYQSCFDGIKKSSIAAIRSVRSILLVTHDCYPHGAQFLLLQIAKQLKLDGFNVKILALGDGELLDEFSKIGRIILFDEFSKIKRINKITPVCAEELRKFLADIMVEGTCDAMTSSVVSGSVVPLLKEMGFRTLSLIHEFPNVIRSMKQEANAKAIGRHADKIVFATEGVCKSFGAFASVAPEKVLIRPQGLLRKNFYKNRKAEAYRKICQKHRLPLHTKIVLGIGYVQSRKGPDLFVDAAVHVLRKRPDATFIWIGDADKETEKAVIGRIAEHGIQDRVLFLGYDPDPMAYYAAASVYALTSREDPFPNVVIESVEVGVPVVAFEGATGASDYILEHGGTLAKAEDAADFAEKLCDLLDNPGMVKTTNSIGSLQQYVLDLLHSLNGFPRVSVVVPNYNYGHLIAQRLDSIFQQFWPLYEVVILDDASTDTSVKAINAYLERNDFDASVIVNKTNSGSVFRQWRQGVKLCKGDLVWIAEADDLAENDFLSNLVEAFEDPEIVLAYSQSKQIDEKGNLLAQNYLDYTKDISDRWQADYTRSGMEEIADSLTVKNTISNASAVVFRRTALEAALEAIGDDLFSYKVAGDWLVYLHVLRKGRIHFCSRPLNWHRRHTSSVTISVVNKKHYDEVFQLQKIAQSISTPSADTLTKAELYMERLQEHFHFSAKKA
jgi:glycosyltransferase involved in cell wall biosynthesis/GT2 family glycosyltransferase